jgi:hypothetical protein
MTWKSQLLLVAAGYVAVLAYAANAFHVRSEYALNHPADVAASGGMYAGGDLILEIFVAFLLMIPTFFCGSIALLLISLPGKG